MAEWHPLPAPAAGVENGQASREADRTEEIYRQLDRICASRAFRGSLRLTRFLRFTVETALVGKSDTIKAYTIAVEALGRDANFDPQSDPIVRVEAGRLRQALARYYAGAGRNDPVLIEFPRGTYVPSFQRTAAGGAPPTKANDSLFSGSAAPEKSADKTVHSRPSDRNALDLFGRAQQLNHNVGVAFDRAAAQSQQPPLQARWRPRDGRCANRADFCRHAPIRDSLSAQLRRQSQTRGLTAVTRQFCPVVTVEIEASLCSPKMSSRRSFRHRRPEAEKVTSLPQSSASTPGEPSALPFVLSPLWRSWKCCSVSTSQ